MAVTEAIFFKMDESEIGSGNILTIHNRVLRIIQSTGHTVSTIVGASGYSLSGTPSIDVGITNGGTLMADYGILVMIDSATITKVEIMQLVRNLMIVPEGFTVDSLDIKTYVDVTGSTMDMEITIA